ncbi:1-deoxy-D-xylulose-5-phosphate reductoisomerase [Helicobacter brantae]|uniref:1-deoxy-D-xylulose 5-phosphate reductoisomerase n=1 Tax=Helicobacter brantae TaxID=375927 RepID=A0A3D8J079_9HELI|nr:1-deoxy-D-xylulose-5-phosphate reductoisomerase [Helicobacter brantae]RDU70898.1 1-deoxy-D-xylulose-5-phosphate reductoisomerase [Helicobacter brantae]
MSLALLGSTGSIGVSTLKVAKAFNLPIELLVAGKNINLLNSQIKEFSPSYVVIADREDLDKVQGRGAKVFCGSEGIKEALSLCASPLVLNALVGFVGLEPTMHSIALGKKVALANKESLVSAGWLIDTSKIIPVDSEHFSLWYLLRGSKAFSSLLITASGGAFRDTPLHSIPTQTPSNALKHPNWSMGAKITIDSASMINKLFEVLEAFWLFGCKNIEALIERKSLIHALVEYQDGSMSAHLARPDMCLAISYALNPSLAQSTSFLPKISLQDLSSLALEPISKERYPLWELKEALLETPSLGVVLNACNEVAVEGFLGEKYLFGGMTKIILESMHRFSSLPALKSLEEIVEFDKEVRSFARSLKV